MHSHFVDNYSHYDSPVHRLATWLKMAIALAIVIGAVAVPIHYYWFFIAAGAILFFTAAASLIPGLFLVKRLVFLEPIVLGVAVLSLFQPDGGKIFAALVARSTICIVALTLLANTTPMNEILSVMKKLKLPSILVTTVALMHRYLFMLIDESQRMRRARASRTFNRSPAGAWKSLATVCSQLFVRSTDRAERVYAAMCARGWR